MAVGPPRQAVDADAPARRPASRSRATCSGCRQTSAHASCHRAAGDEPGWHAHEKLWLNCVVDCVHWASHAGKNFTERQRIKRKAERWGKNYAAIPRAERVAVLAAIMSAEVSEQA